MDVLHAEELSDANEDILFLAIGLDNLAVKKELDEKFLSMTGAPSFVFYDAQGVLHPMDDTLSEMKGFKKEKFEEKLKEIRVTAQ